MHLSWRLALTVVLLLGMVRMVWGQGDPATDAVALVNAERARAGLAALNRDYRLDNAAAWHSADMAAHRMCSHTGTDGSSPWDRFARAGYELAAGGENVGCGQQTAVEVVAAWMASPGHRANILAWEFKDIGMAMEGNYWTLDLGTTNGPPPPTVTPRPRVTPTPHPAWPKRVWLPVVMDGFGTAGRSSSLWRSIR